MRPILSFLILALACGCAGSDDRPAQDAAIAPDVPASLHTKQADRRRLLALTRGKNTRVVVIAAESDDDDAVAAQLMAWREAGTEHVLNMDLRRLERAPALLRLAHLIEISDTGPHASLRDAGVRAALGDALDRGVPVMASGTAEAELRECLGRD